MQIRKNIRQLIAYRSEWELVYVTIKDVDDIVYTKGITVNKPVIQKPVEKPVTPAKKTITDANVILYSNKTSLP